MFLKGSIIDTFGVGMDQVQLDALVAALKQQLKKCGYRYQDLADHLGVSLPTVKRIFAGEDCNIGRIMAICGFVGLRFFDLVEIAKTEHTVSYFLTEEQECYFATNPVVDWESYTETSFCGLQSHSGTPHMLI